MAVTIKRVLRWQTEIHNEPGALGALPLLGFRTPAERRKGESLIRRVAADADGATSGEPAPQ